MTKQETLERVNRILANLAYLLGEKLAWVSQKIDLIREIIQSFIEGYNNGLIIDLC